MTEKDRLHKDWADLVATAHAAGEKAAAAAVPTPMTVGSPKNLVGSLVGGDDGGFDPDRPTYFVSEGACGFGWVNFWPERGGPTRAFCNWLSGKTPTKFPPVIEASKSSHDSMGKFYVWSPVMTQSVARNAAYATAFADVIREAGACEAYGDSRLD